MSVNDENKFTKLNNIVLKNMLIKDRMAYKAMLKSRCKPNKITFKNRLRGKNTSIHQKASLTHLYNFEKRWPSIESHNSNHHFECQSLSSRKTETTYSVAFLNTNHDSDSINLLSSSSSDIKSKVIEINLTVDDDEQYLR